MKATQVQRPPGQKDGQAIIVSGTDREGHSEARSATGGHVQG